MSTYLSKLAAVIIHPGGSVRPRLPGRFEPQSLRLTVPFDVTAINDAEPTTAADSDRDVLSSPTKPTEADISSRVTSPAIDSHSPVNPLPHSTGPAKSSPPTKPLLSSIEPRESAQSSSPASSEAVASQPPWSQTDASQPGVESVHPVKIEEISREMPTQTIVSPAIASSAEAIALDKTSSLPAVSIDREKQPSSGKHLPRPPRSNELSFVPSQLPSAMPAVPPEIRSVSALSQSAPEHPTVVDWHPTAPTLPFRLAAVGSPHPQIEPDTAQAAIESVAPMVPTAVPDSPTEPILERIGERLVIAPRLREPVADQPLSQGRISQPPTVRVTIGRIEVRAAMPPPASPPPAHPVRRQPAISLEQYLQQRSEGKG